MQFFRWQAISPQGAHRHGLSAAPDKRVLRWQLARDTLVLKTCRRLPRRLHLRRHQRRWLPAWLHQWATLLEAGFDIQSSLQQLFRHSHCQLEATALAAIQHAVQRGDTVSSVLSSYPGLFPADICQRIGLAETTGNLPAVLRALARQQTEQNQERQQLHAALRYPAFVLLLSVALCGFALLFLLPRFGAMYTQMAAELPPLTLRLLALPETLTVPRLLTGSVIVGMVALLLGWLVRYGRRYPLSCRILYQLPGLALEQRHLRLDASGLLLSLQAGLPLAEACQLTARYSGSVVWQQRWQQISQHLLLGRSFTASLSQFPVPAVMLDYCQLGEVSGYLPQQLEHVLQQLTQTENQRRQRWLGALPTALLLVVAVLTLILLLALYLPLFQLGQVLA